MAQTFEVSLHPGQAAIYNSNARFKVCAAGRRFGKSHFAALMLGVEALKTENEFGYRLTQEHGVYYIAPTFDQAKRVMWPKLIEILGYERTGGLIRNENKNDGWLELVSGRKIYIKGADNPDSLRGIGLSYVVLDEYADMRAHVWEMIIRPALADVKGSGLFIGTPKGKNHFFKLFMAALEKPVNPDTGRSAWADWEAFHFKSVDNPFLARDEIEAMEDGGNMSREAIRQELEASFVSGGGKVLKPDWFEVVDLLPDVQYNKRKEGQNYVVETAEQPNGQYVITVDLAGFKKQEGNKMLRTDESVICVTYVLPDCWYVLDIQHGHWDARETALRIVRTASKHPFARLGIEQGALLNAIGGYLDDEMRRFNRYLTPEPLRHGGTRKIDRIATSLQGRAERGRIKLVKGDWNEHFLDQAADFPDPLAHDDLLDALAYADQLAQASYAHDMEYEEWTPLDLDSGY